MRRRGLAWIAGIVLVGASTAAAQLEEPSPAAGSAKPTPAMVEQMKLQHHRNRKHAREPSGKMRTPDDLLKSWLEWEHASGDWGGVRPWLHKNGLVWGLTYTAEFSSKVAGGLEPGEQTGGFGHLDVDLTLHTQRLGLWRGGTAFVYFEQLAGHGISNEVGVFQDISTLESPNVAHLASYYYSQELLRRRLTVLVGKVDVNNYFDESSITAWYMNSGFSPVPNIPMPTYPLQAFGFTTLATPIDEIEVRGGAYGADPNLDSGGDAGFFDGDIFWIVEAAVRPPIPGRAGTYRVGGWQFRQKTPSVGGTGTFAGNHGVYLLFDQMILPTRPGTESDQGLSAFVQFSWAPSDRNLNDRWAGGGLMYTGLFSNRGNDRFGLGVSDAHLVEALNDPGSGGDETVFEWFYEIEPAPWLSIQPDLQFILSPGGSADDAVVISTRVTIAF